MKKYKEFIICAVFCAAAAASGAFLGTAEAKESFRYKSFGERDPFVPLAGISASVSSGEVFDIMSIEDVVLGGIMTDQVGEKSVVINGEIFYEGQKAGRLYIDSIGTNSVRIRIGESEYDLELYE